MTTPAQTEFAAAERTEPGDLRRQVDLFARSPYVAALLDATNESILVLNAQREIVFCNRHLAEMLNVNPSKLIGQRPGEAIGCLHAAEDQGLGCGTTEFCAACGAVSAIIAAQFGLSDTRECRISRQGGLEALDLLVRTTPIDVEGERFTLFAGVDISHEKRRRALERIFFHDVMNTAIGLRMLAGAAAGPRAGLLRDAVDRLIEEVAAQRDLMAAESRELAVRPTEVRTRPFLDQLVTQHKIGLDRPERMVLAPDTHDQALITDPALLGRVVGNMVRNAIEATQEDQTVTAGCCPTEQGVQFWVHNPGFIPRPVQLQLFQRSFSTKGVGRGLGTYSMKLLAEGYLGGSVHFTTTPQEGTTFYVSCPPSIEQRTA